jgi:hypothetical protein
VHKERAAEIGLADNGNAGLGFDVLGDEFGKDDLLGEEFGADGDFGLAKLVAGGKKAEDTDKAKQVKEAEESAKHVRGADSWEQKEFNTEGPRRGGKESFIRNPFASKAD